MSLFGLYQNQLQILVQVGLAMLLGAMIGFEREVEQKPAGLRTHMLVAGAVALYVALVAVVVSRIRVGLGVDLVRTDPVRIIEAVVTGISFLGAGTIPPPGQAAGGGAYHRSLNPVYRCRVCGLVADGLGGGCDFAGTGHT